MVRLAWPLSAPRMSQGSNVIVAPAEKAVVGLPKSTPGADCPAEVRGRLARRGVAGHGGDGLRDVLRSAGGVEAEGPLLKLRRRAQAVADGGVPYPIRGGLIHPFRIAFGPATAPIPLYMPGIAR